MADLRSLVATQCMNGDVIKMYSDCTMYNPVVYKTYKIKGKGSVFYYIIFHCVVIQVDCQKNSHRPDA